MLKNTLTPPETSETMPENIELKNDIAMENEVFLPTEEGEEKKPGLKNNHVIQTLNRRAKRTIKDGFQDDLHIGRIGIDGLKIAYRDENESDPNRLFNLLTDGDTYMTWGEEGGDDFETFKIEESDVQVTAKILISHSSFGKNKEFGTLTVNKFRENGKYSGLIFLTVDNENLYNGNLASLPYIEGILHLKFNNFTKIVIHATGTFNYVSFFLNMKRDLGWKMIYNDKEIKDPKRKIENASISKGFSRLKEEKDGTIYLHTKDGGMTVRIYDKLKEIFENSPEKWAILLAWLGLSENAVKRLYRIEVEINNENFRSTLSKMKQEFHNDDYTHDDRILPFLLDETFLFKMLKIALYRVCHFTKGKKMMSLLGF